MEVCQYHPENRYKFIFQEIEKKLQFCQECESFKCPRSHHCRKCKRFLFLSNYFTPTHDYMICISKVSSIRLNSRFFLELIRSSWKHCTITFRLVKTEVLIPIYTSKALNSKTHFSLSRCIKKMDHHCPWINACVGHKNHAHFIRFLFYAATGCFYGGTNLAATIVKIVFYVSVKYVVFYVSVRFVEIWWI